MKKLLFAIFTTIAALSAQAKTIIPTGDGPFYSYSEGGFGYGGYAGSWDVVLPDVTVHCGAVCEAMAGVSYLNGNEIVRVVAAGPVASPSTDGGAAPAPVDPAKAKADCVANCAVQRTVHDNNCTIQSAQLRTKLSNAPAASAIAGGLFSRFIRKKIGGDIDSAPIWGAAAYGAANSEIERKIGDFNAGCAAMGAQAQNDCIKGTCKAWFLSPLLLMSRRRRKGEAEEIFA